MVRFNWIGNEFSSSFEPNTTQNIQYSMFLSCKWWKQKTMKQIRKKLLLWCLMRWKKAQRPTGNGYCIIYKWIYGNRGKTATKTSIPYFGPNKYTHYFVCMRNEKKYHYKTFAALSFSLCVSLCVVYMLTCWIEKLRLSFEFIRFYSFVRDDCFIFISYCRTAIIVYTLYVPSRFVLLLLFRVFFLYLLFDFAQTWYVCRMNMCVGSSSFVFVCRQTLLLIFFLYPSRRSSFVRFNHFSIRNWTLNVNVNWLCCGCWFHDKTNFRSFCFLIHLSTWKLHTQMWI